MVPNEAFVLAGGKGERLKPLTDHTPKPLLPIRGKPILQHVIEGLAKYGVKKIILGLGYKPEKIREHFGEGKEFGVEIIYNIEKESLGTGGALKYAEGLLEGRFIMLNGDNLTDINYGAMTEVHETNNALCTIALYEVDDVSGYGVVETKGEQIISFVEKPKKGEEPSNLINAGAYILEKETVQHLPNGFSLIEKTMFPKLADDGRLFGYVHSGQWFPTDDLEKYEKAKEWWV